MSDIEKYVKITSEKDLNALGYVIPEELNEQMDIIFGSESLKAQTRFDVKTLGIYVGGDNKLIGFVEPVKINDATKQYIEYLIARLEEVGLLGEGHSDEERLNDVITTIRESYDDLRTIE